ncbi:diacylglycerol/lipid kinase family protein [Actinoplanes awajinensis]|uniref:Sphingosine kinase n=1 Tax=Actinoplanes awajinensis subsp. mycoplanecinus TaxID=135947 RepID=A0A101JJC5_9ACTN|nr:diacylglycerol kinase family protein [Actinoplanes awajinensis]KUL27953.1 sphingosine kinase [Actinoplanes awajinensis subsp. mycoplanecinus]
MANGFIAVLANPRAGRGRHRGVLPGVVQALGAAGHPVRLLEADSGTAAEQACHRAVDGGAVALVAVGGDGTVHRVLQAVAGRAVGFGVVPGGTGNDFASAVGVPHDPLQSAEGIAAALVADRDHRIDAVRTADAAGRERWFCAVLAAGFDALVNDRANRMVWPRGPRRYDLAILLELARLRARTYTLEVDGEVRTVRAEIVAVGNAASYGGGMRILPDADPADGLLDVIWASPLGRTGLTRLKPRLRGGTHVTDPRVHLLRGRHVRVVADGIIGYADGERLGPLPLDMKVVPGAIRLLC